MLEKNWLGVRCRFSLLFPALLTVLLLRQPDGLAILCVLASMMHESGHLLMMLALGNPPERCTLGAFGMRLEMGQQRLAGYRNNIVISLAGPAVNAVSAMFLWRIGCPRAAAVHLTLCGLNLLPASALDGGQILTAVLSLRLEPRRVQRIVRGVSAAVLLPLAAAAGWLFLSGGNGTLLVVSVYLTLLVFFHEN